MLNENTREALRSNLELLRHDIVLELDAPEDSDLAVLVRETAEVSPRVRVVSAGLGARRPAVAVRQAASDTARVVFAGTPGGHEFTSFVLALLHVGGHPPKRGMDLMSEIAGASTEMRFTTFYSQSCQNCPDVVQALNSLAALAPNVTAEAVDGAAFVEEVEDLGILALPTVLMNGEPFHQGRAGVEELLGKVLDLVRGERQVVDSAPGATPDGGGTSAAVPFDVVVVGGGPAGVTAAVYAARKGLRTGIVADRIGGQVLDTDAIENLIALRSTTGPAFAATLEDDLLGNGVEILRGRTVRALLPGDGSHTLRLDNDQVLEAPGIVLAPGARWRLLGVDGESEYRNRGVTFCPHCDGPLFRGKDVVVVGGGNSGVEAALDLSGICARVTILEYAERLRADAVLIEAAKRRPNIRIVTGAETLAIEGDGRSVTALAWRDRSTGEEHRTSVSGVFVQIGLVPNTDWLDGAVRLSERGEIETDERGRTSLPGVTAAGDATTAPYKQIVSALGSGATAAISLFEHLVSAPNPVTPTDRD